MGVEESQEFGSHKCPIVPVWGRSIRLLTQSVILWMRSALSEGEKRVPSLPRAPPISFTLPGRLPRFPRAVFSSLVIQPGLYFPKLIQVRPYVDWRLTPGFSEGPNPPDGAAGLITSLPLPRPPPSAMGHACEGHSRRAPKTSSGPGSVHWAGPPLFT